MSMKDEWVEDYQEAPVNDSHYSTTTMEVWDVVDDLGLSWVAGNVLKYLARYKHKGQGRADLLKAVDYLFKESKQYNQNRGANPAILKEDIQALVERHWK